jgi:hypothetical protein
MPIVDCGSSIVRPLEPSATAGGIADCRLSIAGLPIADCRSPIAGLPVADW